MKTYHLAFLLFFTFQLHAQDRRLIQNPVRDIPRWVRLEFEKKMDRDYAITYKLYPHVLIGDFNGDGRKDVVIQITEKRTGKTGFAIFHGKKTQALFVNISIAGAGTRLGISDDNLAWVNLWNCIPHEKLSAERYGILNRAKGDVLVFSDRESRKEMLFWNGKKYEWFTPKH